MEMQAAVLGEGHAPVTYRDINQAFRAMKAGEVARTVLVFD
jgi:Zn-dependent alcohol dehydrogenase